MQPKLTEEELKKREEAWQKWVSEAPAPPPHYQMHPLITHKSYTDGEFEKKEFEDKIDHFHMMRRWLIGLNGNQTLKDRHFKKAMKKLRKQAEAYGIYFS